MICEGRLKSSVAMEVLHKGQEMTVTLAAAGDGWRDSGSMLEVIPEKQNAIELEIMPFDSKKKGSYTDAGRIPESSGKDNQSEIGSILFR